MVFTVAANLVVLSEERKQEINSLVDEKVAQMKQDIASHESWEHFHSDENVDAYRTDVTGGSIKKVIGITTVNTKMTPKEFMNFHDGMFLSIILKFQYFSMKE
jgi:hypothetical protein